MKEAENMQLRALIEFEKIWGLSHKKPLDTRYNLTVIHKERSLFQNAAQHLNLVVEGYNKILGPEH